MGLHLPPTVALLLTIGFIVFLFRRDIRERPNVTGALWLPVIWLLLIGSRTPTQWLSLSGLVQGASMEEGNAPDAFVYFTLIVWGIYVLSKRHVQLSEVIRNNKWLTIFLVYCFIAIFWSDFPFIAFKRWIKILGHPIMALILLTDPDPYQAIVTLMKRSAYIFVPLSILFIKYYPELGRAFDAWTGAAANCGLNTNKNELGWICMVLGFFLSWHLLQVLKSERSRVRRSELFLTCGLLCMIWWLLHKAQSATATMCLLFGLLVVVLLGLRFINRRLIGLYVMLFITGLVVAELTVGAFGHLVNLSGREATISGRGELWNELLALDTNPIFGTGFESFWLGDRLKTLWDRHWWHPTEAHNGYLETYLNLGFIGLFLLAGVIIATFRKIRLELLRNFQFGRLRLGFLAAVLAFNWTEASFKGLSVIWFAFYIIAMDYPTPSLGEMEEASEFYVETEEMELA